MSKKPVVVYGASGYTGRLICEALRNYQTPVHRGRPRRQARRRGDATGPRHRDGRLRSRRRRARSRRRSPSSSPARRSCATPWARSTTLVRPWSTLPRRPGSTTSTRPARSCSWTARARSSAPPMPPRARCSRRAPRTCTRRSRSPRTSSSRRPGSTRWRRSAARSERRPTARRSRSSRCSKRPRPRSTSTTASASIWPKARGFEVNVPGLPMTQLALPWGGGTLPLYFERDARVRSCRQLTTFTNRAMFEQVIAMQQMYEKDIKPLPAAERAAKHQGDRRVDPARHAAAREPAGAPLRRARRRPRRQPRRPRARSAASCRTC